MLIIGARRTMPARDSCQSTVAQIACRSIWSPRVAWRPPGCRDVQRAWADANGFTGEAGKTLLLPGADGALAGALFGIGERRGRLASVRWRRPCRKATGTSPPRRRSGTAALGLVLGGYRLHPLRQETWQGDALWRCRPASMRRRPPHRRWRLPGARSGQHADQRHGAGRAWKRRCGRWQPRTAPRSR